MKKILIAVMFIAIVVTLAGCNLLVKPKPISKELSFDEVYAMAEDAGYTGTMEELIAAFRGEKGADGKDGVDGVGIVGVSKTASTGLIDTYSLSLSDGSIRTFMVTNGADGVGIRSIEKTATRGLIDTYTIAYTNGTTFTFDVTNGENGAQGPQGPSGNAGQDGTNGVGVKSTYINDNGELVLVLSNDSELVAGSMRELMADMLCTVRFVHNGALVDVQVVTKGSAVVPPEVPAQAGCHIEWSQPLNAVFESMVVVAVEVADGHTHEDEDGDCRCDTCPYIYPHEDDDYDCCCDNCGAFIGHIDEDNDCMCDICETTLAHEDNNADCVCDICLSLIEHTDVDIDGFCDVCGVFVGNSDIILFSGHTLDSELSSKDLLVHYGKVITFFDTRATGITNSACPVDSPYMFYKHHTLSITSPLPITKIVFTSTLASGDGSNGFDGMTIGGATIAREGKVTTITLSTPATSFATAPLPAKYYAESVEVFFHVDETPCIHTDADVDGYCDACGEQLGGVEPPAAVGEELSIHFLELGNKYTGDCTLIKVGDVEVLIDAGSRKSSAETICDYVDDFCTDGVLEYVIATHAHQDHIAGFIGTKDAPGVLESYDIGTIIEFARTGATSQTYADYQTARDNAVAKGAVCYNALECYNNVGNAKRQYDLAEGVTLNVLYNYYYDHNSSNENEYSVCVLLSQGDNHFLFTGDLEEGGEKKLIENNELPRCKLFKGGHHGSATANTAELMAVIQPEVVCVCACCGSPEYTTNDEKLFPSQAFVDHVLPYTRQIYITTLALIDEQDGGKWDVISMNGNIVVTSGEDGIVVNCSNNSIPFPDSFWFGLHRTEPANAVPKSRRR